MIVTEERTDDLLTVQEVAHKLRVPKATIYAWNSRGLAPPRCQMGRHVRYRRSDVEAWLRGREEASKQRYDARARNLQQEHEIHH